MKFVKKIIFTLFFLFILNIAVNLFPVRDLGVLKVEAATNMTLKLKGRQLVNYKGNAVVLRGVSSHGLAWYPEFINKNAFKTLKKDWKVNLIRLALYTSEYGGYVTGTDKTKLEKLIDKAVKATKSLNMYCIIDWHILTDGNPLTYKSQAISFFKKMAKKYKGYKNVLYEICNEPNGVSWSQVKKYADSVIPAIRKYDKNSIIIVGTPTWSQDVDVVAKNPVKSKKNVMYSLHFYAKTHTDWNREKLITAMKNNTPVFVTEFSICDASGNGEIDYNSAAKWKKLIKKYKLSYAGWSLSNKAETSALIKSSCKKYSGWTSKDLTAAGRWLRKMTLGK
ncbi:endoglucanase [Acetitomaculum ruminis DSM 5522]|uniref:cellulase n=1 Tax=Acetitomaculum ruminis DSM 5522 TaxID=1120918 RepID=A0A1I0X6X0_9FIRM|nr:glycoside hydrolase family 5 protein [Acetitomaculum ruminis]SFA96802.1 endoglucanase [Acetitomaculum ruminis DSM 5522]